MRKNATNLMPCALATVLVLALAGTAWGQTTAIKGLIVGRNGPDMIIRAARS
jgi:hypothetical protein